MNYIEIHEKAMQAAKEAAEQAYQQHGDMSACGFAWVKIFVDGRTKLGKSLAKIPGWSRSYDGSLQLWNPSKMGVQSVYILEKGAEAYAKVFSELSGVKAYAGSRLD